VRARDAAAFECIAGGGGTRTHPVYDRWLRITGRDPSIETAHRQEAAR
jgi:hypothetical protein